jgi:hypothetical protein
LRIACLAWGSLVWDPRTLPHSGPFLDDGPELPIEFSRVSLDGRVTLVIDSNAPLLRTLWVPLDVDSLNTAVDALGRREKIEPNRWADWVGRHSRRDAEPANAQFSGIDEWLEARSLDALVWTALPSRTPEGVLAVPSFESLRAHLESLSGEARARAEQYVRRTPLSVRTPHRSRFESEFGWHPRASG